VPKCTDHRNAGDGVPYAEVYGIAVGINGHSFEKISTNGQFLVDMLYPF
jgi:hypothetical protein